MAVINITKAKIFAQEVLHSEKPVLLGLLGQLVRPLPNAEPRGGRGSRRAHRCKGGQGERGRAAGLGGAVRGDEHPHPAGVRAGQAGASGCGARPKAGVLELLG